MAALGVVMALSTAGCAGAAAPSPAPPPVVAPEVRRLVTYVELPTVSYADTDCPRPRYLGPGVARALQEAVQAELTRAGMQVTTDAAAPEQLVVRFEPGPGGLHRRAGLRVVLGLSRGRREAPGPRAGGFACRSRGLRRVRRDQLRPGAVDRRAPDDPAVVESPVLVELAASLAPDPPGDAGGVGDGGRSLGSRGNDGGAAGDGRSP